MILITSPDRLARRYAYQVWLLEELARAGCEVVFLERPPSDDPQDALLVQIRGAVAEYERTVIADRTRRGRLAALQVERLLPWSTPPYGYRADPEAGRDPARLIVDAERAAVVRQIFAWYVEEGLTLRAIARQLSVTGTPTANGLARWDPSTVRGILRNTSYRGVAYGNREQRAPARRRYPLSARAAADRRGDRPCPPGGDVDRRARARAHRPGALRGGPGPPGAQPALVPAQHARGLPPASPRQLPPLRGRRMRQQQRPLCLLSLHDTGHG